MKRDRNGLLLLAGDGFSSFGAWIDFLAILTLAAYQFEVTPYQMAVVSAGGVLPGILLAPAIGRLCDRRDPKRILLLSMVARAAATGAILFCRDYALFVALVGLRSVFASVAPPAINVLAVRSVEAAARTRFYSLLNVLNSSAKVFAPAIGTVSSSLSGEALALVMSLTCSVLAFAAFAFIRVEPWAAATDSGSVGTEPVAAASRSLAPLLWVAATYAFVVFMVNNLVPLVLQRSGFDKSLLGLLVSCSAAGNIASGLWLARKSAPNAMRGNITDVLLPAVVPAIGFGAFGVLLWAEPLHADVMLAILFLVIGVFSARYAIALNVHVSAHHASSIGHAWGVVQAWQNTMILVAPMLGAAVLEAFGPASLFGFATAVAGASYGLFFVALRIAPTLRSTIRSTPA